MQETNQGNKGYDYQYVNSETENYSNGNKYFVHF